MAAYLMALTRTSDPNRVDALIKDLGSRTGARVRNNVQGTTSIIANNGFRQ